MSSGNITSGYKTIKSKHILTAMVTYNYNSISKTRLSYNIGLNRITKENNYVYYLR